MIAILLSLISLLPQAAPFVSQTVRVGDALVAYTITDPASGVSIPLAGFFVAEPIGASEPIDAKGMVLTTTIKDPVNPDEPVTVTTTRGPNESAVEFWYRHDEMVKLIRRKLRNP